MDTERSAQQVNLCDDCLRVLPELQNMLDAIIDRGVNPSVDLHFKGPDKLQASYHHGCKLCAMIIAHQEDTHGKDATSWRLWITSTREIRHIFPSGGTESGHARCAFRCQKALRLILCNDSRDQTTSQNIELQLHRLEGRLFICYTRGKGLIVVVVNDFAKMLTTASNTGSEECLAKIKTWLRNCDNHDMCKSWKESFSTPEYLPTRLLDVFPSQGQSYVRLVCDDNMPSTGSPYLTLSHCWGGHLPFALRQTNLAILRGGITLDTLPHTFQDAVQLARRLEIQYLWIDALCIIQDSREDWRLEAGLMSKVYANAHLNVAALHAYNPDHGLFKERDLRLAQCVVVPSVRIDNQHNYLFYVDNPHKDLGEGPLTSRAWVVQERFLCRRIVYFGNRQITWECHDRLCSECLPSLCPQPSRTFKLLTTRHVVPNAVKTNADRVYEAWETLLNYYTQSDLTYGSDRLVAVQGMAQAFCKLLGVPTSDFVNGLWKARFVDGLLWRREYHKRIGAGRHAISNASNSCSWTWGSSEGAVSSNHHPLKSYERQPCQMLAVHGSHTAAGHEGAGISGWCSLRAPVCRVMLSRLPDLRSQTDRGDCTYRLELNGVQFIEQQHFLLSLDYYDQEERSPVSGRCEAYLLHIRSGVDQDGVQNHFHCLLVRAVAERPGYFERIGHLETCSNYLAWEEIEPEVTDQHDQAMAMPSALTKAFESAATSAQTGKPDADRKYTITLI